MSSASLLRAVLACVALTVPALAQDPTPLGPPAPGPAPTTGSGLSLTLSTGSADGLGSALEIVLLMTLLSLGPAIVMTMTSFTRIVIVLSFLRRAISIQEMPPAPVVTGFAVFMTLFVMAPVVDDIRSSAWQPLVAHEIDVQTALERGGDHLSRFMLAQTRTADLQLMLDMSNTPAPATPADVPFHVVVPAFVLSEIKTAFQMGFALFLPFVAIDLIVSSLLISMGMFTLPPVIVSTPLKVLLFVLVDGWNLVVASLTRSFAAA